MLLLFQLILGVLRTQTELLASSKASASSAETVDPAYSLCKEVLKRLPQPYDIDQVSHKYPVMYTNSMNTVLRQELIRWVVRPFFIPFHLRFVLLSFSFVHLLLYKGLIDYLTTYGRVL